MKIRSVKKVQYSGKVYNIGTKPNHNYYANGILVHNCYMNSTDDSAHVMDAVEKIEDFFGSMSLFSFEDFLNDLKNDGFTQVKADFRNIHNDLKIFFFISLMSGSHKDTILQKLSKFSENQRPFQVALGGGNPNEHPLFPEILTTFDSLDITPNYTTNGMGLTDKVLEATNKYCGGVALSCHPHLTEHWQAGVKTLSQLDGIKLSYHHVIGDIESVNRFINIFENEKWDSLVRYHVLLPMVAQGRAKNECEKAAVVYLFDYLEKLPNNRQIKVAFGARFYEDLIANSDKIPGVSLYEPEAFSQFLDLKDMRLYGSSFDASAVEAMEA